MFTSVATRSANAYKAIGVETVVTSASPHQLIDLLFDALHQQLHSAKSCMLAGDIQGKGKAIGRVVRILEEGLKASLDIKSGGALASNLSGLYDYCIFKASEANLRNDLAMIEEVIQLIHPISDGWKKMGEQIGTNAQSVH